VGDNSSRAKDERVPDIRQKKVRRRITAPHSRFPISVTKCKNHFDKEQKMFSDPNLVPTRRLALTHFAIDSCQKPNRNDGAFP
jgi:hypothetical protein